MSVVSKPALLVPKSATLAMNANVQCNTASPFQIEVRLDGVVIANLNSTRDDCNCMASTPNQLSIPLTAAQAAAYAAGSRIDFVLIDNGRSPLYGFTSLDNTASNDIYGTLTYVY